MRVLFGILGAVVEKVMSIAMGAAFASASIVIVLTLVDIGMRNIDKLIGLATGTKVGLAIVGLVDISQLFTMVAASLSIGVAFYRGSHVAVDLLTVRLSGLGLRLSTAFSTILNLTFTVGCFYAGLQAMRLDLEALTSSPTISIPYVAFWIPMLSGFALSFMGILLRLFSVGLFSGGSEKMENEVLDYV